MKNLFPFLRSSPSIDNTISARFGVFTKTIHLYKPIINKNERGFHLVCIERNKFFHDEKDKLIDYIKQMEFDKEIICFNTDYLYLLVNEDSLVAFFQSIKNKWVKEIKQDDGSIYFEGYWIPIYILDENGNELTISQSDHNINNVLINSEGNFFNLYLCKTSEIPIFYSLKKMMNEINKCNSGELSEIRGQ